MRENLYAEISNINVDVKEEISRGISDVTIFNKLKVKRLTTLENIAKRTFDIIGSICGIALLVPITIGIKIANIIHKDKGPVFYTQTRIGKDGKEFKLYKYRSMIVGADEKLKEYLKENEDARKEYKKYKKLKNDPRITKVGAFIRKTSLDEFPQFINVLKGDMSLVGPRPYLLREQDDIGEAYNHIIKCKPGLTGIWQVSGRNDVTFEERVNMDLEYYYNQSVKLDIKLILKTLKKVLLREGAL